MTAVVGWLIHALSWGLATRTLTWNEEHRPADDDKIEFPLNGGESDRSALKEDEGGWIMLVDLKKPTENKLTSKLAE